MTEPLSRDEQEGLLKKMGMALPIESWQIQPRPGFRLGRPGRRALETLMRFQPGDSQEDRLHPTWLSLSIRDQNHWILLEVRRGSHEGPRGFDVKFDRRRHTELLEAIAAAAFMRIADAQTSIDFQLDPEVLKAVLHG